MSLRSFLGLDELLQLVFYLLQVSEKGQELFPLHLDLVALDLPIFERVNIQDYARGVRFSRLVGDLQV